ncbi:M13 family metallopeptidase [Neomicrococcus aestuarii]|uniref:Peptidase M13 n=1 Tax=Neomicrococcus aestuarii TaxID=556325 RepID=A0A1L2ZNB2_9MICC|nr:M13-type metalloendopeptidase [Neomicrococcus aestuarii]APF40915.1 peptidase M13 [Neomicrococcus aestuarii]
MTQSIRPQDDLFRSLNGAWMSSATIPADRGTYGSFEELREKAEANVHAIIEESTASGVHANDPKARRISDLFASFMDIDGIEARGAEPIKAYLEEIDTISTIDELFTVLGRYQREGISGIYGVGASNDPGQPDRNLLTFLQSGLGLPDESYYREEQFAELKGQYQEHLVRLLTLAGRSDAAEASAGVVVLEESLASHHWDRVKSRDAQARYNLTSAAELFALHPLIQKWLTGAGIESKYYAEVNLWQPSFLEGVEKEARERPLEQWKSWLTVQVVRSFAPYLSEAFVNEGFEFYQKKLAGVEQLKERWKRGVSFVEGGVGEDVGQLYVAKHFPPSDKATMEELVERLVDAYRESIQQLPWMTDATKEKALEKLGSFRTKIGYPDQWIDYSSIETTPNDVIQNAANVNEFEFKRELQKIDDGVDRELWFMFPQTVNAYYHPLLNEIAFPAAILQLPFFDAERDTASNFGSIGAVIGHEIGHGFDDQGSQFDGTGQLNNWWTDEDRAAFEALTGKLVAQFDELEPPETPGNKVNGKLTLGENIGDLGGLGIAYKAYKLELQKLGVDEDEVIDGRTGDQRFFGAWAESWRSITRSETMLTRLKTDPHSPNEFRCNQIVKNLEAFHQAYQTQPGDGMWLDPEDRVVIW